MEKVKEMDDDTREILTSRAYEALTGASEAAHDARRGDLSPADRAAHARCARELAQYAETLFRIAQEGKASP